MKFSWISDKLIVGKNKKGHTLFAKQNIKKDDRLIAFGGHILTIEQYKKLPKKFYDILIQVDDDLLFGPTSLFEIEKTEYLNHSCNPNCGFSGSIFIIAMKDIKKGEEINIDYAMCLTKFLDMECLCLSKNCRHFIKSDDWKIKKLQKKYINYFSPFIIKKIKKLKNKKI